MLEYAGVNYQNSIGLFTIVIHFDVGMGVESLSLGKKYEDGSDRSSWFCRKLLERTNSSCSSGREK